MMLISIMPVKIIFLEVHVAIASDRELSSRAATFDHTAQLVHILIHARADGFQSLIAALGHRL
jgi:hypothetical protein